MPKNAKRLRRPIPSALRVAAVGLLVLAVAYVVSVVPAYRLGRKVGVDETVIDKVYAPVWFVVERLPPRLGYEFFRAIGDD